MISMQYRYCLLIDSSTHDKMVSSSHLWQQNTTLLILAVCRTRVI